MGKTTTFREYHTQIRNQLAGFMEEGEAGAVTSLIFEHYGYPRDSFYRTPSLPVSGKIQAEVGKIVQQLLNDHPIQYLLGQTEFMGLPLRVNPHVLIPRFETEEMVDLILRSSSGKKNLQILDLGTGSGCIAIALAKHLEDASVHALEKYPGALSLARKNALMNKAEVRFIEGDMLSPEPGLLPSQLDLVVSNPPYVREKESALMAAHVKLREPASALFVPDDDPVIFYRAIAGIAANALKPDGVVWVEMNEALGMETAECFKKAGFGNVDIIRDMQGKNRIIKAQRV